MRAPFFALLISAALANAYAQDTRRVTEPKFPPSCTVLTAGLASRGTTLAESDENKPDTNRIQQAMDRCQPGQAVELKAGGGHDAFLSGPLQLRRGVTLLIDKGVILFGSRNPRDYDVVPGLCGTITEKKVPYTQGIVGPCLQTADRRRPCGRRRGHGRWHHRRTRRVQDDRPEHLLVGFGRTIHQGVAGPVQQLGPRGWRRIPRPFSP